MKFKNIFFGFLKTWLLATLFYSGSLYGSYMFITLQDYLHTADEFRPYIFEKDLNTGNLIKVFDTENNFQFKTYSLSSKADMVLFETEVRPVLLEWNKVIFPPQYMSSRASGLSKATLEDIDLDISKKILSKDIHVAIYKGNIEGVSYVSSIEAEKIEISTLIANPKGLTLGQTTYPKGGGSALLNYELQRYKAGGVERVRLLAIDDKYYQKRGWQIEPKPDSISNPDPDFNFNNEGACG